MDNVNVKLMVEYFYLKEYKVKDINDLESKFIGFDG